MNKISDEQVIDYLADQISFLSKKYDKNRIIGIFAYGKVCYGFAESEKDLKTLAIYIPTFEELCTKIDCKRNDYLLDDNNNKIQILDIRLIFQLLLNQDTTVMEIIFSEYNILQPKYKQLYLSEVFSNKEMFFHNNKGRKIRGMTDFGLKQLELYKETESINSLFEACRARIAMTLFLNGTAIENCINFKKDYHINYLQQILDGTLIPNLDELKEDLEDLYKAGDDIVSQSKTVMIPEIKEIIMKFIKVGLEDINNEENFVNSLTISEKEALNLILKKLDPETLSGNISISAIVQGCEISRPVFKNVLQKMENNSIAEIINMGVKGTYIKIYSLDLIKEI